MSAAAEPTAWDSVRKWWHEFANPRAVRREIFHQHQLAVEDVNALLTDVKTELTKIGGMPQPEVQLPIISPACKSCAVYKAAVAQAHIKRA